MLSSSSFFLFIMLVIKFFNLYIIGFYARPINSVKIFYKKGILGNWTKIYDLLLGTL